MPLSPGDHVDRYVVAALLGRGGMGEVYRAYDPRIQRAVALKILHPELAAAESEGASQTLGLARLLREARAAAALEHPNAVAIYDVGEVDGMAYLAMEFIAGQTLRAMIRDATVNLERRVRWLVDVARALAAAHRRGLVHRDIKPENVMLRDDGAVKVLDFGIARRIASAAEGDAATEAAVTSSDTGKSGLAGTPAYMAPEQIRARVVNAATDQFSWGVMAYELVTGRLPWSENNDSLQLIAEIVSMNPAPPSRATKLVFPIPPELDEAILRALSKEPKDRFASMSDVAAALEPLALPGGTGSSRRSIPQLTPSSTPRASSPVSRAPRSRRGLTWAGLGMAAIAAGALGWRATRPVGVAGSSGAAASATPLESSVPEARAAYAAALDALRDATIETALRELQRAITLDPTFAAAYLRRALLAVSLAGQAREDFNRASELRAHLSEHDRELLHAFEALTGAAPDPKVMAGRLEEASRRAPTDVEFLFYLGKARWFDGDWAAAVRAFDEVLARDPDLTLAVRYKASSLAYLGEAKPAAQLYESCLAKSPGATACAWDLLHLYAFEGQCAAEERLARDQIARNAAAREFHGHLAEALLAQGAPEPAVVEALKNEWQKWDPQERAEMDAQGMTSLDVLRGDFGSASARVRSYEQSLDGEADEARHADAFAVGIKIATDVGSKSDVIALTQSYEARHAAWPIEAFARDESILIDALAYRAGALDRRELVKRRAAWLVRDERAPHLRGSMASLERWYEAYAFPCATPDDAAEALAALPVPSPVLYRWAGSDEVIGEMYRLAGSTEEAVRYLAREAKSCTALTEPLENTWATYHLGELLESKGDRDGACYATVLSRWGQAVPASRTADAAARRSKSLRCGR